MKAGLYLLLASFAVVGCTQRARTPPEVEPQLRPAQRIDGSSEAAVPPNSPTELPQSPESKDSVVEPLVDSPPPDAECNRIAELAQSGDHKPAVDGLAAVLASGAVCEVGVLTAVDDSRRILARADALIRLGLDARRAGDPEAARVNFGEALALYPRYYWVQRLLAELPVERADAGNDDLFRRASKLRSLGQPRQALELLETADPAQQTSVAWVEEVERTRTEVGDERLAAGQEEQREGNLQGAVVAALEAIEARPAEPVRARLLDFSRRLGLQLFSAGELLEAREMWRAALTLDDSNELLLQYIDEVEARLKSLDDIKADDPDGR